jgi:hypothetical protein
MSPIVFAGPSLYRADAAIPPGIDIAPPAGCGDLLKAARDGRRSIGLIDGTFETGPAVWHKEILYALGLGCRVFGASSMGALRAAECEAFGMVGVGEVFAAYATGRRESDGDVALTYGPAELQYPPLSLALVDVEDALARMLSGGAVTEALHQRTVQVARSMFFKDRTWEMIFHRAGISLGDADVLLSWLAASGPGLKTRDALELLRVISRPHSEPPAPYGFQSTLFFDQLHRPINGG